MQYLVQMKLVAQGRPTSPEAEITLAENYIFPSVEMFRKLREEKKILAGGTDQRNDCHRGDRRGGIPAGTGRNLGKPTGLAVDGNQRYSAHYVRRLHRRHRSALGTR